MVNEQLEIVEENEITFDEKLNAVYTTFIEQNRCVDEALDAQLKVLLMNMKEDVDTKTYILMLYMEGVKYEGQDNKNAARYCALRIYAIAECMKNPRKKHPRNLNMQPYEYSEEINAFVVRYTDFLAETFRNINRRLFILTVVVFVLAACILMIILRISMLIAAIEAFILGILNYLLQKRKIPVIFMKNQLKAIESHVEEDVLAFDNPIRYS